MAKKRKREYVIGHENGGKPIHCGGIERYKLSIHGGNRNHAGMIGYLQDGTPDIWRKEVNAWISDLSAQTHEPPWSETEQLTPHEINGRVASCSSIAIRADSTLRLTHLWIDLK